jgi:hypothetical protein
MTKNGNSFNTTLGLLLAIFIVLIFGGRYIFNNTLPKDDRVKVSDTQQQEQEKNAVSSDSMKETATQSVVNTSTTTKSLSCAEQVKADLTAKKQSYAKGQILVTFATGVEYTKAKDVLSVYGLVVQNEIDSQNSFKSRHLITAAVAPGQEIAKVCLLRNDSQVKYAGLDLYFGLHE